jgi:hypothetical protein
MFICDDFEFHDPINQFIDAGEHDDRQLPAFAQAAHDLHSVLARHLKIKDQQIDAVALNGFADTSSTEQRADSSIVFAKILRNHLTHRDMINYKHLHARLRYWHRFMGS